MSRKLSVLVVDDERNLRELLIRELARKGHEVKGATDGREALDRVTGSIPDVVLLDMKMPRMDGIELLRELQRFPESPQVIVMTGFQEVSTAVEAMKLGAYDYLTKPARIEELDVLIRKAAEKGRLIRENLALRARVEGGDPQLFLYPLSTSEAAVRGPAAVNLSFYRNQRLDDLLVRASQLGFRPERLRLYQRAQALLADELPWIPLYVRLHWAVARADVRNLRLHPSGFHRLDRVELAWSPFRFLR